MRDKPSPPSVYRDASFLHSCNAGQARSWFEERQVKDNIAFGGVDTDKTAHLLEYIVFRRNEPAFDELLARYGSSQTVLQRLFERGGSSIKVSVCANSATFSGDRFGGLSVGRRTRFLFRHILENGTDAELQALCQCSNLSNSLYTNFLDSWVSKKDSRVQEKYRISDERFIKVLHFISQNKRLTQRRDDTSQQFYWDGFAEYEYNKFFYELWGLAEVVPTEHKWAEALAKVYDNLDHFGASFGDIEALLLRWTHINDELYSGRAALRTVLAKKFLKLDVSFLEHSDFAIRRALYQCFDPDHVDFKNLDYFTWRQKDEYCEFEISQNAAVLRSPQGRRKYEQLLWRISRDDNDMVALGFWRKRVEELKLTHPDWFSSEDIEEELEFDPVAAKDAFLLQLKSARLAHQDPVAKAVAENDALGRNVLERELGEFGTRGLDLYNLDKSQTDRLIAHTRSDAAMTSGIARSALEEISTIRKKLYLNTILCVLTIVLLILALLA